MTNDYSNFASSAKPYALRVLTGNENIVLWITIEELIRQERRKYFSKSYGEGDIVKVPLCEFPQERLVANSGYLDHSYLGKPQIELSFQTPTTYDISFRLGYYLDQFIQHAQGTVRAVN